MLYSLIGNGTANNKEVLASLASIASTATENDDFWMILRAEDTPSPTVTAIVEWLNKTSTYYEVVGDQDDDDLLDIYGDREYYFQARRPLNRLVNLTKTRLNPNEKSHILALSDDFDADDDVAYVVSRAVEAEIPCFDLGGQMTPIVVEDEPEPDTAATPSVAPAEAAPEAQEAPAADPGVVASSVHPILFRDDLEDLTANELRTLVKERDLQDNVGDMRSRAALIDALLGTIFIDAVPFEEALPAMETVDITPEKAKELLALNGGTVHADVIPADSLPVTVVFMTIVYQDGSSKVRVLTKQEMELALSGDTF
jgi:hypothetical protein